MTKRKRRMAAIAVILAAVLIMGSGGALEGVGTVRASDAQISILVPENKVPTYEYKKAQDFLLNITNNGTEDIRNFVIGPVLEKDDHQKWPFKTDYQDYSAKIDQLEAGKTVQVKFSFTERDDIPTARYTIHFEYYADNGISGSSFFYVNTTAKPDESKKPDTDKKEKKKSNETTGSASAGGFSNDEAIYSDGGGGVSDGSVPRVIVTGFSTNPEKVKAGSDFTLTIHLRNTSKKTRVKNMLFDLTAPEEGMDEQTSAPAFLPSSGSSSIYLEGMKAGGTADISIKLNAKSDLLQKPYSVELSMKYEDANYNAVETTSSISIPVKQDARFEFSDFEINPESIAIEDEANVMCSLYNLGRIKLYNVKALFEGEGIEREEIFVGNVESGATASIDAMLKGIQVTEGPAPVKMTMSYENEEGEVSTEEQEFMLEVTEAIDEPMDMDMAAGEETEGGFPWIPVAVIVLLGIAVAVLFVKKRRKKKSMDEEEELLYELDRSSEDERQ